MEKFSKVWVENITFFKLDLLESSSNERKVLIEYINYLIDKSNSHCNNVRLKRFFY